MASITDKITDVRNSERPNIARVASARGSGVATLSCNNLAGWPTASKVHFVTYQTDTLGNPLAGTQLDCYGIVSGSDITSFTVVDGNDQGNQVNDVVEMLPTAAWGQDLADALTVEHHRNGTHSAVMADSVSTPILHVTDSIVLPSHSITSAMLSPSKSAADARGWIKRDYGTWQEYEQSFTATNLLVGHGGLTLLVATISVPTGITDSSSLHFWVGSIGGFAGRIIPAIDNGNTNAAVTSFALYLYNTSSSDINWSGSVTIFARTI